jgi:L-threonylcarbamoyladenylate synthase
MPDTLTLPATEAGIATAAQLLCAGDLVAFPTETVYGLGGNARDDHAVAAIFAAKDRPRFNPLIVHVPDLAAARRLARFDATAERLAAAFWPGPMTLVLPLRDGHGLSALVTAGLDTVALRVPAHPVAAALLRACGLPLAAPSANPSGKISPTRAEHVLSGLSGRISAVLDGGACGVGVESTIIGLDGPPTLLRPGGLAAEEIEALLGTGLATGGNTDTPTAPGQLKSHYAPGAALRLNVTKPDPDEIWIGFGPACPGSALTLADERLTLSRTGDLIEAAARLFHALREADRRAGPHARIACAPIPDHGLGRAINDRLTRAAAPRP